MNTRIHNINHELTFKLLEYDNVIDPQVKKHMYSIQHYDIYVVNQTRGRCYYDKHIITIPQWAFNRSKDYLSWYVAHECSHAYAGYQAHHGPLFMQQLQRICPAYALHYETAYKPRNAMAAGISKDKATNMLTLEDFL